MKRDFQDKTFKQCSEYQEFREYITGIPDLKECPRKEIINEYFEEIRMDSLFRSPSLNILVDIEHQSTITEPIMFRNLKYYVTTKDKHKMPVQLHIFHTGRSIAPECYFYDKQVMHSPYFKQTYENDGTETFNSIKNKLKNNQELSSFEIFDLIWLPRFNNIKIDDNFLKEYIDVVTKLRENPHYYLLKTVTAGWIHISTENEDLINYMKERFNMMSLDSEEFKDYIATAIIERKEREKDEKIDELTTTNKELTTNNEKLTTTNKELTTNNEKLTTTNKELVKELSQKDNRIHELEKQLAEVRS